MTNPKPPNTTLPHHKLIAYRLAVELIAIFGKLRVGDARCREQARKSLTACALNLAEGAGRRSRADKSRVYAIALGEGSRATGSHAGIPAWVGAMGRGRSSGRSRCSAPRQALRASGVLRCG